MGKVEDRHMAVIATATPDTQLLRLSRDALQAESRADVSNAYDDALPLLEEWIINLGRAAAMGTSAPITFALPDTSAIVEVGDNPKPILQVKGVTWITHLGGESRFLNSSDGGQIGGHGYFPVSRFGWLQAAPGSRIQAVDSSHWQRSDPEWSAVEIFHEVILRKLLSNREIAEERIRVAFGFRPLPTRSLYEMRCNRWLPRCKAAVPKSPQTIPTATTQRCVRARSSENGSTSRLRVHCCGRTASFRRRITSPQLRKHRIYVTASWS